MGWIKDNWQGLVLGTIGAETIKSIFGSAKTFDWSAPIARIVANPPLQSSTLAVVLMVALPIIYYSRWKFNFDRMGVVYIVSWGGFAIGYFLPFSIAAAIGNAGLYAADITSWADAFPFAIVVVWLSIDVLKTMAYGLPGDPPAERRQKTAE